MPGRKIEMNSQSRCTTIVVAIQRNAFQWALSHQSQRAHVVDGGDSEHGARSRDLDP